MPSNTVSVYETAEWGARLAGEALVRKAVGGELFVNEVRVETIHLRGQFSVLGCVDGRTHVVLTSFLRLVPSV